VKIIEHGWPRPYLARALVYKQTLDGKTYRDNSTAKIRFLSPFLSWGGSTYHDVSWSDYDNWPLSADDWMLDVGALALDLAVVLLLIAVVGAAAQWRARRSPGWFRFHLVDLLAALTCIAVLLGIYTYHARLQKREAQAGTPPLPPSFLRHDGQMTASQEYIGPVWLRKLVGNAYFIL
jgi:hypothetical protein